jgi:hypothetical protein
LSPPFFKRGWLKAGGFFLSKIFCIIETKLYTKHNLFFTAKTMSEQIQEPIILETPNYFEKISSDLGYTQNQIQVVMELTQE